jgi:nitrogen fixation/metabolism regulation signal transduction histidine kinase
MADSRRKYLLDPRFQLKWTSYLVVVVVLVMAALGYVIAKTASHASDTASLAVKQAEKAYEESKTNNELTRGAVKLAGGDNPALSAVMEESLKDVDAKSETNLAEVRRVQEKIVQDRKDLQLLLAGAMVALVVLLALMGIIITHRIVGPVHRLKRLLRRVSTGRLIVEERLRRGDELEDLFDTFLQMTYSLRAMQTARIATLDGTLRRAEASGSTPEDVVAGMRALRAQLVLGLEPRRPSAVPPAPSRES